MTTVTPEVLTPEEEVTFLARAYHASNRKGRRALLYAKEGALAVGAFLKNYLLPVAWIVACGFVGALIGYFAGLGLIALFGLFGITGPAAAFLTLIVVYVSAFNVWRYMRA